MAWLAYLTILVLSSVVKCQEWDPAPSPVGHFTLSDAQNNTCLLMTVGMTFHVPYVKNDTKNTEVVASYSLPANADVTGTCKDTAASITLSWGDGFNVTVKFERNDTVFYASEIITGYVMNHDVFPDCKDDGETRVQSGPPHDIHAMPGRSYLCDVAVNVTVGNVSVTFSDLQVQPFLVKGGNFSKVEECAADMPTTPSAHTIPVKTTAHPGPIPVPKPTQNNYTLTDSRGKVCFIALMAAQIQVNYTRTTGKTALAVWNVPKNTAASGTCGNDTASLQLVLDGGLTNLTIVFVSTKGLNDLADVDTDSGFKASEMILEYVETEARFPDSVNNGTSHTVERKNLTAFPGSTGMSYKCNSRQVVELNDDVTLRFEDVHLQPFQVKGGHFDPVEECAADKQTTPGPTNTTTLMTTMATVPTPRPVHDPSILNFTLTDDDDKICFMALMGLQIEVNYTTQHKEKATARWNVPKGKSVNVTGECSNTTTTLTLIFDGGLSVVTMTFKNQSGKGGTVNKFMVSDINFRYVKDKAHFPDAQPAELDVPVNVSKHNLTVFKGELGFSYRCNVGENITLNQNVTLRAINVHVEPFGLKNSKFDEAEVCEADNKVTTLRPIIVGCAIAGIDVLMLLYYGIGRRMRRNKDTR